MRIVNVYDIPQAMLVHTRAPSPASAPKSTGRV
jgi:hypothetical protein